MKDSGYFLIGILLLVTGILLIFFGLKVYSETTMGFIDGADPSSSQTDGYIAMLVIGAISLVISLILFIVAFRKFRENKEKNEENKPSNLKNSGQ